VKTVTQLHQGRQKPRQRLAGAGRRDQQRGRILAGLCQQRQLMLARRPAARREPLKEAFGQQGLGFGRWQGQDTGRHTEELSRRERFVEGLAYLAPLFAERARMDPYRHGRA